MTITHWQIQCQSLSVLSWLERVPTRAQFVADMKSIRGKQRCRRGKTYCLAGTNSLHFKLNGFLCMMLMPIDSKARKGSFKARTEKSGLGCMVTTPPTTRTWEREEEMKISNFEVIEAWQSARESTKLTCQVIAALSAVSNDFGMKGQITTASVSVMPIVAEGFNSGYDSNSTYHLINNICQPPNSENYTNPQPKSHRKSAASPNILSY